MKGFFIRSTKVTPSVYFNPQKQILDLRGKSSPENPVSFYTPLFKYLEAYPKAAQDKLIVNLAFEYFNTSSSKCIFLILDKLKKIHAAGKKVVVNWFHEEDDEDMMEAGEDYSSFFDYEFNFKEVPEITVLGGQSTTAA
ncbi:DUF1987 domain-containing protein [Reichenbachiella versicolor]|uniref:DUF1987 domain-containing protein n=1 Tax=Reichenbachiella versicolor TaxID=1821036 RepID=UPI000D6E8658|nr:DUF1987 domain-containing protein [Reichenbachiella versicolor]